MTQTGRPPVPLERKQRVGTLRPDKLPGGQIVRVQRPVGELTPPEGLGQLGQGFWETVTRSAGWLWADIDYTLLEITAEAYEERAALRQHVMATPDDWRSRASLRQLDKQLLVNLGALGFTPTDRARLGVMEAKAPNKLDELLARLDSL